MTANFHFTIQANLSKTRRWRLNWLLVAALAGVDSPGWNPIQTGALAQVAPRLSISPPSNSPADVNAHYSFVLKGQPAQSYLIQASSDLSRWVTIATNRTTSGGSVVFTDPGAGGFSRRFYRAIPQSTERAANLGFRSARTLVNPRTGI